MRALRHIAFSTTILFATLLAGSHSGLSAPSQAGPHPPCHLRTILEKELTEEGALSTQLHGLSPDEALQSAFSRGDLNTVRTLQARIEEALKNARLIERKELARFDPSVTDGPPTPGHGRTEAYRVRLRTTDGIELEGIWKPGRGEFSDLGAEVAAYEVGKRLSLNVPVTVERTFPVAGKSLAGSLQLFIHAAPSARLISRAPGPSRAARSFDSLIGNLRDRHADNYLFWYPEYGLNDEVLIDHGQAFFFSNSDIILAPEDAATANRLRSIDENELRQILIPLVGEKRTRAFLQRRRHILFRLDYPDLFPRGEMGLNGPGKSSIPRILRESALDLAIHNLEILPEEAFRKALEILRQEHRLR